MDKPQAEALEQDEREIAEFIGMTAASNLQKQLPDNQVSIISNEFVKDRNRVKIKLKVHSVKQVKGKIMSYEKSPAQFLPSEDGNALLQSSPGRYELTETKTPRKQLYTERQHQSLAPTKVASNALKSVRGSPRKQSRAVSKASNRILGSELEMIQECDVFIAKMKAKISAIDLLENVVNEEQPERQNFIQKITQSNQTILAQLERLTWATSEQIRRLEHQKDLIGAHGSNAALNKVSSNSTELEAVEHEDVEKQLRQAYKTLDRCSQKLRTLKAELFFGDDKDDHKLLDELGDNGYFKLQELSNNLSFINQEVAALTDQVAEMQLFKEQQTQKIAEHQAKVDAGKRFEADLKRQVKEQKALHREMSLKRRVSSKEDAKVFSRFVSTQDEKLVLRSHAKQSPRSKANTQLTLDATNESAIFQSHLSPRLGNSGHATIAGRSVELAPKQLRSLKILDRLNLQTNIFASQDLEQSKELEALSKEIKQIEYQLHKEAKIAESKAYELKHRVKGIKADLKSRGERQTQIENENKILQEELRVLESGKSLGKQLSKREIDITSVSRSLIQDGGRLKPVLPPSGRISTEMGLSSTRSVQNNGFFVGNRSRMVVRDFGDGTTQIDSKIVRPTNTLANQKASVDVKFVPKLRTPLSMVKGTLNSHRPIKSQQQSELFKKETNSTSPDVNKRNQRYVQNKLTERATGNKNMVGVDDGVSFTSDVDRRKNSLIGVQLIKGVSEIKTVPDEEAKSVQAPFRTKSTALVLFTDQKISSEHVLHETDRVGNEDFIQDEYGTND